MRGIILGLLVFVFAVMTGVPPAGAACSVEGCDALTAENVREAVQEALLDKMKYSGTLDLYDAQEDRVRNLQKIKIYDEVTGQDGRRSVLIDFRDINSGAVVVIEGVAAEEENAVEFQSFKIKEVRELSREAGADQKKEYADEDIQAEMRSYLDSQSKFTGFVNLFDEKNQKLRKLELIELTPEVRKLGILNISRAQFKDLDSQEILGIDVTLENRKGKLMVQSLRIREIKKAPVQE